LLKNFATSGKPLYGRSRKFAIDRTTNESNGLTIASLQKATTPWKPVAMSISRVRRRAWIGERQSRLSVSATFPLPESVSS
jgi:hypothetical protein